MRGLTLILSALLGPLSVLLGALACNDDPAVGGAGAAGDTDEAAPVCPDTLVWETAGQPVMTTYCAPCHSAELAVGDRSGAPENVNMDTLDGARSWAEPSILRIEAGEMPPTGGVTPGELERFQQWVDCGAPGVPLVRTDLPVGPTGLGAARSEERMEEGGPGDRIWQVEVSEGVPGVAQGLWTVETWTVEGNTASLVTRERYDRGPTAVFIDEWSPPLRLVDQDRDDWEVTSERTRTDADGSTQRSETWVVTAFAESREDPVEYASDVRTYLAVEDGGEEQGVSLDGVGLASQRWNQFDDEFPEPGIASAWRVVTTRLIGPPSAGGPLQTGMTVTRIVVEETP